MKVFNLNWSCESSFVCEGEGYPVYSRDNYSSTEIAFVRTSPLEDEVAARKLYVTEEGMALHRVFQRIMNKRITDFPTLFVVRCVRPKLLKKQLVSCRDQFDASIEKAKSKFYICIGRESLKHAFMRSQSPPEYSSMTGRLVTLDNKRLALIPSLDMLTAACFPVDRQDWKQRLELDAAMQCIQDIGVTFEVIKKELERYNVQE